MIGMSYIVTGMKALLLDVGNNEWGGMALQLSNDDIKRELIKAKNISVHPLIVENIKGGSINLTASNMAWKVSDKKSAVVNNQIIIPARDTVCIYTNEALWVSKRIGGTYHSRVSLVSRGLGHISTTLDPGWAGVSLVALNNPTDNQIIINVGDAFVSIMFYYLNSPSSLNGHENLASRPDIARSFKLSDEESSFLDSGWHRNEENITNKMKSSIAHQEMKSNKLRLTSMIMTLSSNSLVSSVIGGLIVGILIYLFGMN